jgi:predicted transcriptional regulator
MGTHRQPQMVPSAGNRGMWRLFPTEIQILQMVRDDNLTSDKMVHSLDVPGEYIGRLLRSLLKRGFIEQRWLGGYRLTKKGRETVSIQN